MPETTHVGHVQRDRAPKRYTSEAANLTSAPDAWIAAAVDAATLGELYAVAREMQAAGAWNEHYAAMCRVLRDKLGAGERVTAMQLALLERELGAIEVAS